MFRRWQGRFRPKADLLLPASTWLRRLQWRRELGCQLQRLSRGNVGRCNQLHSSDFRRTHELEAAL